MAISSPETSLSLLDRLREPVGHDAEEAWERLVPIYQSLLQKWLRTAGLQQADRDDLSQRVLEVLVRRLPTFKHNGRPGAFRAWLRGITVNFLREFWRQKPTPESSSVLEQLVDPHSDLSKLWDEQHDRHVLNSLLQLVQMEFTDTSWRAFQRLVLDGISARDVAAELGITVNAVIVAKSRVLARLRQEARGWLD
ncbi:MAG TPA: sigma-70 family RNA polymerase sigma factor [Gemmataceae bacterium]|nr:sigma-70 family RNA polymerase sigma factor [Gemmataceae bacterium]